MKRGIAFWLGLMMSPLFFPGEATAEIPSVTVQVDKESITIGDEITYELRITHGSHVVVELPKEETDFSPFELKRYRPLPRREVGNQITEGTRYFLTIFRLGTWKIPSFTIPYTEYRSATLPEPSLRGRLTERGVGRRRFISTDPLEIHVKSVLGEAVPLALDIQRLKTPERLVSQLFKRAGLILFAMGALCIGIYGLIRLLPKPVPRMARIDPTQSSLKDLKTFQKKWLRQSITKAPYEDLSKILRCYLANQYDPLRLDRTTTELHDQMLQYRRCQPIAEKTHRILTIFDLVKFANRKTSQGELENFLRETEEIVRYQMPSPTPPLRS